MEDQRSESRISYHIRFFVHVHQCEEDPDLVGASMACEAVDFSPHGVQLRTDQPLSPGSLINITIGIGDAFAMYLLRGEVRWVRESGGEHRMGVLLQDVENTDYHSWVNGFSSIFDV